MSKAPFLFPIRAGDIALFTHPDPEHLLHSTHFLDGDLTAGNGYIAIRAHRGLWAENDFPPASYDFRERLGNLPWHSIPPATSPEWRSLDDIRGDIYARAIIHPWTNKHRPTPSPVWRIGTHHRIRLSHLQLLARLPRAQVYAGTALREEPLYIRFNGGIALMPPNRRLETQSREIFPAQFDRLQGYRKERTAPLPWTEQNKPDHRQSHLKDWPPIDTSED